MRIYSQKFPNNYRIYLLHSLICTAVAFAKILIKLGGVLRRNALSIFSCIFYQ